MNKQHPNEPLVDDMCLTLQVNAAHGSSENQSKITALSPVFLVGQLNDFVTWSDEVWTCMEHPKSIHDLLVICAGLSGEAGELLEQHAYMGTCRENPEELRLEFGDVLYYWARIVDHFDLDLMELIQPQKDTSFLPSGHARLPISIGVASEAIKKFVRNDKLSMTASRKEALIRGMWQIWQDWSVMADHHCLDLHEIMALNQKKLLQRHTRRSGKGSPIVFLPKEIGAVCL